MGLLPNRKSPFLHSFSFNFLFFFPFGRAISCGGQLFVSRAKCGVQIRVFEKGEKKRQQIRIESHVQQSASFGLQTRSDDAAFGGAKFYNGTESKRLFVSIFLNFFDKLALRFRLINNVRFSTGGTLLAFF
jgi:hypothetical protein